MHTPLCRHAEGEPSEYAEVAFERGLKGITVTCHNPLPDGIASGTRMYPHQFEEYLELVEETRRAMAGKIDVRLGLEADFLPGLESWVERQLSSADFNYVLGSVHPQLEEYWERYWTGDPLEYQLRYFELLAQAAESGLYDSLSHPDLVKNISPEAWEYSRVEGEVKRSLDRIATTGMAMELNTSGLKKRVPEMNPNFEMLEAMRERDIPVVVGADAHNPQRVGDKFLEAYSLLSEAGYTEVSYFLGRERQVLPIEVARESLDSVLATASSSSIR